MKKPLTPKQNMHRSESREKSLTFPNSPETSVERDCARIEHLEQRVLYSVDPIGLSVDTLETGEEYRGSTSQLLNSNMEYDPSAKIADTASQAQPVNDSTSSFGVAETLVHNDTAVLLDSSYLNQFGEVIAESAVISDSAINSKMNSDPTDDRRTIMVGGINDAPVMSGFSATTPVFTESGAPVLIGPFVTVSDPDLDLSTYNDFELMVHRSGGAEETDNFGLGGHASGTNIVDSSGATIGTILQNSAGTLHLRFNSAANGEDVSETVRAISYSSTAVTDTTSQITLLWTLNDNNAGAQGSGGALLANYVSTVDIVAGFLFAVDDVLGDVLSGTSLSIPSTSLLNNDTGLNSSTATVIGNTDPSQGLVTNNGSSLDFSSANGDSGVVSFDYTAMSGNPNLISQWQLNANGVDDAGRNSGVVVSDSAINDLIFDGNDYVELPPIDYPDEFTLTFDFKVNDLENNNRQETLFSQGDWETQNSLFIRINGEAYGTQDQAGMLVTNLWDNNDNRSGYNGYMTDIRNLDSGWHNYAIVVREGLNPASSGVLIYIDGIQQDTSSHFRGSDQFEPAVPAYIGIDNHSERGLENPLTSHEVANFQLLNGFDAAGLEHQGLNALNEFSTATVSLDLRSEEVLVNNELLTVAEDQLIRISDAQLLTVDSDDNPTELIYTIVGAADHGFFVLNSVDLGPGDSFSQQDISDGKLDYRHNGDENVTADSTLLRVDDGMGSETEFTVSIELTPVNDAPALGLIESDDLLYTEGSGQVELTDTLTVFDSDGATLRSATISISENFNNTEDLLSFTSAGGISGSFDSINGVLMLSGVAPNADWQSVLRSVSYQNSSDAPDLQTRSVSIVINDGSDDSTAVSRNIQLFSINDSPLLSDGDLANVVKNSAAPAGDTIENIFTGQFSDLDGTFAGIVIINDVTTDEGNWQYSTDDGVNWFDIQPVGAASALVLDVNSLLRFIPATDYTGTVPQLRALGVDDTFSGLFTDGVTRAVVDITNGPVDDSLSNASAVAVINSEVLPAGPVDLSGGVSLNIDGGNDSYLFLDDGGEALGGGDQFTVESQFSIDSVIRLNTLFSYAVPGHDNEFRYGVLDDARILVNINGVRYVSTDEFPQLLDGNRHAVAISWNSENGELKFYVDGVLTHIVDKVLTGEQLQSGGAIVIGQEQDSVLGGFDPIQRVQGVIYDVRIWNEERTVGEIARYSQTKLDSESVPDSLVLNWQMDGINNAGEVNDIVGGRNLIVGHASGGGFSNSTPSGVLQINENAPENTVIGVLVPTLQKPVDGQELGVPVAISELLAADSRLHYDSITEKLYRTESLEMKWEDAQNFAASQTINGIPGQLVTIESAYENEVVRALAEPNHGLVWIGASDQTREGDWRWQSGDFDGALFWTGDYDGESVDGVYSNWRENEPNNRFNEDFARMVTDTGVWNDARFFSEHSSVIEWDANLFLPQFQFSLQSDPTGIFAIDSDSGELTAPNSGLLDFESASFHDVTVRVTDVNGYSYDETVSVQVVDAPSPVFSNVETVPLRYLENNGAVNTTATLQLATDSLSIVQTATIHIGSGYVAGQDILSFVDHDSFTSSWNSTDGSLVITGTGTDENWQEALRSVTFENTSENPIAGDRSIVFSAANAVDESLLASRVITVVAVNDAPLAGDLIVTLPEDTFHTLAISDFSFTDPIDNHELTAIHIVSAPLRGELQLNGLVVNNNQEIPAAEVAAGNLVFYPEANTSGLNYDNISFRVQDNGGVSNGGDDLSNVVTNLRLDVTEASDPPQLLVNDIALSRGGSHTFTSADIEAIDKDVPELQRLISLTVAPSFGRLELNGTLLEAGEPLTYADILAGRVTYVHDGVGTSHDNIVLSLADAGASASASASGSDSASIAVMINETHPRSLANTATVAEGLSVSIPVLVNDIIADQPLVPETLTIVNSPDNGTASIDVAGNVVYTHDGGEILHDSFLYTIADAGGDVSDPVMVSITVNGVNDPPVLDGYSNAIIVGTEDTTVALSLADLRANSTDAEDGLLHGLVVQEVGPGHQLLIGETLATAVEFQQGVHNTIDADNNAYWTPAPNANGLLSAFIVNGIDSEGALSLGSETVFATVTEVNDPPVLQGYESTILTGIEDAETTITLADLRASSADVEDVLLDHVVVQNIESGELLIGASRLTASPFHATENNIIDDTNLAFWTPLRHDNGSIDAFVILGKDSDGAVSESPATVKVAVVSVNDSPAIVKPIGPIATIAEDSTVEIDFNLLSSTLNAIDLDDSVVAFVVDQVTGGTLKIGADQESAVDFSKVDNYSVDANNNAYWTPNDHENGNALDAFTVQAQDSFGQVSGVVAPITIEVNAVNDAPTAVDRFISISSEAFYGFNLIDFGFTDHPVESDTLEAVQIVSLPDSGELLYRGASVVLGQEVAADEIAIGLLQYKPQTGLAGELISDNFEFSVRDNGGTENGGQSLSIVPAVLSLSIENIDSPSVVNISTLQAPENSPVGTLVGQIQAIDPDPVLTHLSDGGFNTVARPGTDFNRYSSDGGFEGDLGSWQVISGAVDVRGTDWATGPDGGFLLDLNGDSAGAIEQTIETVPGARYSLEFVMSGHFRNTDVNNGIVRLQAITGDVLTEFQVEEQPGWSQQNLNWQQQSVTFTATDDMTTIGFRSLTPGGEGPIITDISVQDALRYELLSSDVPFSIEDNGTITVAADSLDHETQDTHDLRVEISEPDGQSIIVSLPLNVTDVNEIPVLLVNEALTATVNTSHVIDNSYLAAVDEDETDQPPEALTYTLLSVPGSGVLSVDGNQLVTGSSFSQQDINQQRLTYTGSTAGLDSFTFLLADGKEDGVLDIEATFTIESYDAVQFNTPVSWSISEAETITLDDTFLDFSGGYTEPAQLRIDVLSQPASVEIRNQQTGQLATQFTLQQLHDGEISLSHDGSEPVAASLQFELYRTDTDQPTLVDTDTIELQVADVAEAPTGVNSEMATDHANDLIITIDQLGFNDNDDADTLKAIVIVTPPVAGALLLQNGVVEAGDTVSMTELQASQLRFQPDPLTSGVVIEVIEFKIIDSGDLGNGGTNESQQANTITVTVTSDHVPRAVADSVVVEEGATTSSLASGDDSVLSNDTDLDTPTAELLVQIIDEPLHGALQLNQDGTFVYRHDGSETTADSFTYRVVDANRESVQDSQNAVNVTRVDIVVLARNDNPEAGQAENQIVVTEEPFRISLPDDLFTDAETPDDLTLTATLIDGSALPEWLVFEPVAGVFSGSPDSQSAGQLVVTVTATDSAGASVETSFGISVQPMLAAAAVIEEDQELFTEIATAPQPSETTTSTEVNESVVMEESIVRFVEHPELETSVDDTGDEALFVTGASTGGDNQMAVIEFEDKVIKHNKTKLLSNNSIAPVIAVDDTPLQDLFFATNDLNFENTQRALGNLDRNLDQRDEYAERQQLVLGSSVSITAGVSIGYLVLLARGGLLIGSLMSSMPAWRFLDPVPVLQNFGEDDDDQDESLETIVDRGSAETETETDSTVTQESTHGAVEVNPEQADRNSTGKTE